MAFLVHHLCKHVMKDPRKEFFVVNEAMFVVSPITRVLVNLITSRPGILVLINDADWELEGEADYLLQKNDNILFVSTLHGG